MKEYYTNINRDLLSVVPINAGSVIEFGCGAGAFGSRYKEFNPNCLYFGVENEPEPSAAASHRLDQVFAANAEHESTLQKIREDLSRRSLSHVDALVYGDVIEHLVDPWKTLRNHLTLLQPGGTISICVPNSQHWSLSLNLAIGSFEYADSGLLDRTHLRFFTRSSLERLLAELGVSIVKLAPRKFGKVPNFVKRLSTELAKSANLDASAVLALPRCLPRDWDWRFCCWPGYTPR